jgi:signal transduction histidine kinase
VTHELKTPLTSIRLQAETIADHGSDPGLIERLLEDTSRLESQVERTLELARLEGGGEVFLQTLPVRSFLERLISSVQQQFHQRVSLKSFDIPADLVFMADQTALQVIFKNMIENSIRYSGHTTVEVKISGKIEEGRIHIHYEDNGKTSDWLPKRLGQLFQRGGNSQGAGVGLYLIRTLMEKMGGWAVFASTSGGFQTDLYFRPSDEGREEMDSEKGASA